MATEPDWTTFKYPDFKGATSHTKRIGQFIDQFQSGEKFLTQYGLVKVSEIRFTRQDGSYTDYTKTSKKTRMESEWATINTEKKPRAVEMVIVLVGGRKRFRIPITDFLKTGDYGGKKGSKLNKGTQFEKWFY